LHGCGEDGRRWRMRYGYEGHLKPELLSGLSEVAGFRGSYLLCRVAGEEVEFMTIILRDSIEAVRAMTGDGRAEEIFTAV
jgi:hypothetical protein